MCHWGDWQANNDMLLVRQNREKKGNVALCIQMPYAKTINRWNNLKSLDACSKFSALKKAFDTVLEGLPQYAALAYYSVFTPGQPLIICLSNYLYRLPIDGIFA